LNIQQLLLANQLAILPLSVQLCEIASVSLSIAMANKRAERIESMLVHAFYKKNFILPETAHNKKVQKLYNSSKPQDKKVQFVGGLVLEPKSGFYDT